MSRFIENKLSLLTASRGFDGCDELKSRADRLSQLGVDSAAKGERYLIVKKAAKDLNIHLTDNELSDLIELNIKNYNDACYSILDSKKFGGTLNKVAYPNPGIDPDSIGQEFDLKKWLKIVHLIYDSVSKGDMTKNNALDYYSNYLNIEEDEDVSFKKWFEYYSQGEHLKYSSEENGAMKKNSFNLGQGNTPYYMGGGSHYLGQNTGLNMPGDSFVGSTFDEASGLADANTKKQEAFSSWKRQLHTAVRRIDKLLRNDKHLSSDAYKLLAEQLMNLSVQVQCLKMASTISDVTIKTANNLSKMGQGKNAEILKKIAQEVPPQPEAPPVQPPEEGQTPGQQPTADTPPQQVQQEETPEDAGPTSGIPRSDDVEPARVEDIKPIPGPRDGEYSELAGAINIEDAAKKLDEVAGMLADRRIIRQLAEFDIMLDKIGIASMFPELAESQSKLIDAFSYALTRVTKMMGQLSNAKALADSQSRVPGTPEEDSAPEASPEASPEGLEQ